MQSLSRLLAKRVFSYFMNSHQIFRMSSNHNNPSYYEENLHQMKEMSKIVFSNLDNYSLNQKIEILRSFGAYELITDQVYNQIEKSFIKNLQRSTVDDCINILKGVKQAKRGSEQLFLLLDHKLLSSINSINPAQIYDLVTLLVSLGRYSSKLIHSLHLSAISKITEYSTQQLLTLLFNFMEFGRSKTQIMRDTITLILNKTKPKIPQMNLNELSDFIYLFFGDYILHLEKNYQKTESARQGLNNIIFAGKTDNGAYQQITLKFIDQESLLKSCLTQIQHRLKQLLKNDESREEFKTKYFFILVDLQIKFHIKYDQEILNFLNEYLETHLITFTLTELLRVGGIILSNQQEDLRKIFLSGLEDFIVQLNESMDVNDIHRLFHFLKKFGLHNDEAYMGALRDRMEKIIDTLQLKDIEKIYQIVHLSQAQLDKLRIRAEEAIARQINYESKRVKELENLLKLLVNEKIYNKTELASRIMEGLSKNGLSDSREEFLTVLNYLEFSASQNKELRTVSDKLKLHYESKYLVNVPQKK